MKTLCLSALFLAFATGLFAQNKIVEDGALPESELHVAINPYDSNNIVLAVMKGTFDSDTFSRISLYYTQDYGETWQKSDFNGKTPGTFGAGDPVLAFDRNGRVYLVSLTIRPEPDFGIRTVLSWSDDQGATWQTKTLLDDTDKPWFAIDRSPLSPFVDRKYVPQATDWLDCLTLGPTNAVLGSATPAKDDYEFVQLASVDLQADGDVYVGFYHEKDGAQGLSVARSADGGATFLPEVQVASTTLKVFTSITGIMYRLNLSPYLAVDRSDGPYRDRIYYTFTDNEPAQDTIFDVYLAWSDNDGATWTTPKKVHPATAPGTQQFYSSIYVTENGTLLLGWYDRRNDPADLLTDFYLGISHDGGVTFQEVKVTSTPTDFSTIGLTNAGFGIGDYGQIVATPHTALPFWADGRTNDGDMNVYFARVPLDGAFVGVPEIMTVSEHISFGLPYPIPATDAVHIPVHNLHPEHFTCRVLGTDGKLLATHQAGLLPAGKNELTVPLGNPGEAGMVTVETAGGVIRTFKVR